MYDYIINIITCVFGWKWNEKSNNKYKKIVFI